MRSLKQWFGFLFIVSYIVAGGASWADEENTVDATATYDTNNVFARILRGELPADIVYENEHAVAFWDIRPRAKVHVLVIPRGPYTNFVKFTEKATYQEQVGLLQAIREVGKIMNVHESGFRLLTNTGHNGGQTVPHLHFHVLGGEPVPGLAIKEGN
ncbi:MAG: histidine triad nucleotide-binding protein [Kordiimonas sp.]